jgi:hypothetical protein
MVKLLINKIKNMCYHGVNSGILLEYLKSNPPFKNTILGIENLSVVERDSIYFKIKLDNFITPLYSMTYRKYKLFERDFKLKQLQQTQ